ncbi:hypothetical protein MiSe_63430 [Microseira wollei NIES-4236]|uniref:DUF4365 domain-containing protein n=2 Tax=Microseira wollei TaxID=467598 RepID=A0AAV3XL67_9CYAN|nr:hypothetical protein MiSe_63430 [Microseira wollei NIES-4236]
MVMSYQSDTRWDLEVYNRDGKRVLVVQLKSKLNASVEWAVEFRRNILAHGIFPTAPYFLMVFPDRFYLWIDSDGGNDQSKPNYVIDARPIVGPYLEKAGIPADRNISVESLEIIFGTWLSRIIYSEKLPDQTDESQQWLIDSGLYAAIAGGSLKYEAVA